MPFPLFWKYNTKLIDTYRETYDISRSLIRINIVDISDVSPVGAAPTTSSFSA